MTLRGQFVAAAFKWACLAELEAPKPGNVHFFAAGHHMTAENFICSADAAAEPLCAERVLVGARILGAVEATLATVGTNTNLGIVLLCAPLAAAAETNIATSDLHLALTEVLRELNVDDAELTFRAIVRAAPAGLGHSARYDVFGPASVNLLQAMTEAADRDRIAYQYMTNFADIFDLGLPLVESENSIGKDAKWTTLAIYLNFLAAFPDSHISRKFGVEKAASVQSEAAKLQSILREAHRPIEVLPTILAWDAKLKAEGVNPGTTADLTVATLFAHRLQTILPSVPNSD